MTNPEALDRYLIDLASTIEKGYGDRRGVAVRILANRIGCSTAIINLWVNGESTPTRHNAKRLERATQKAVPKDRWS